MTQMPERVEPASTVAEPRFWGPLIALWIVWGSTYLGIAMSAQTLPPQLSTAGRFAAAAAVLALIVVIVKGPRELAITMPQVRSTAVMGVALLGVGIGTLSLAERYVPSGIAALLVGVTPMWIVIFRLMARDRPSKATLLGVAIGMCGLAIMLLPGGTKPVSGTDTQVALWSIAVMVSSFCWALFSWRARNYNVPANSLVTAIYEMVFAAIFLSAVGFIRGERLDFEASAFSWIGWAWLIVASIIGYSAYSWLIAHVRMSLVSTYAFINPVVAVILGVLILREAITLDVLIGLIVVVGSVGLIVLGERQSS